MHICHCSSGCDTVTYKASTNQNTTACMSHYTSHSNPFLSINISFYLAKFTGRFDTPTVSSITQNEKEKVYSIAHICDVQGRTGPNLSKHKK